jgi:hypothetical protein
VLRQGERVACVWGGGGLCVQEGVGGRLWGLCGGWGPWWAGCVTSSSLLSVPIRVAPPPSPLPPSPCPRSIVLLQRCDTKQVPPPKTVVGKSDPRWTLTPRDSCRVIMCGDCSDQLAIGDVCSVCYRMYQDEDGAMTCCDGCNSWIHSLCDKVAITAVTSHPMEKYFCPRCRQGFMRTLLDKFVVYVMWPWGCGAVA